jgi:mono/diheme cytochrome c family protein
MGSLLFSILAIAVAGRPEILLAGSSDLSGPVSTGKNTVRTGHKLFLMNCAHCHGADAHGDEGPDLHGMTKSDQGIAAILKNGIKGEMPKFGAKLSDTDVQALIAYLRSIR